MSRLRRMVIDTLAGATLGALFLGLGARIAMRLLAISIGRDTGFSLGGSLEVIAYGAIIGTITGALWALFHKWLAGPWWAHGTALGLISYAGTIATLPAHLADTARPFADQMTAVLALFGLCFLLFGLTLARVSSGGSSRARAGAPAGPRE